MNQTLQLVRWIDSTKKRNNFEKEKIFCFVFSQIFIFFFLIDRNLSQGKSKSGRNFLLGRSSNYGAQKKNLRKL